MEAQKASKQRELFQRFKVQKFLGKGSYGSVYRVKRLDCGQVYAVKEADVTKMTQGERTDAVNEIRLLASIRHPNVINYCEAFLDGNWLCIIMEYATQGDLSRFIRKGQELQKPFPEDVIWKFFIQILQGVQCLHENKVIHRDIKPMNIFISDGDVVKVGDLGVAKVMKNDLAQTQIGTPHYMSPEQWRGKKYDFSCDLWALGCLLYEMMTYSVPFKAKNIQELRAKAVKADYPKVEAGTYSPEMIALQEALMSLEPKDRPQLSSVLGSSFIKKKLKHVPADALETDESQGVLKTIKVPRDIRQLGDHLPASNYKTDKSDLSDTPDGAAA